MRSSCLDVQSDLWVVDGPSCLEKAVGGPDVRSELGVVQVMDLVGEVHLFFLWAGGSPSEAKGMDWGQNILKQPFCIVVQRSPKAGEPEDSRKKLRESKVYPRVCGGTEIGDSPRARTEGRRLDDYHVYVRGFPPRADGRHSVQYCL